MQESEEDAGPKNISLIIAGTKGQERTSSNVKDNRGYREENGALVGESIMDSHFVSPRDYYLSPSKLERGPESRSSRGWSQSLFENRR